LPIAYCSLPIAHCPLQYKNKLVILSIKMSVAGMAPGC
jgi:hypothetical protein